MKIKNIFICGCIGLLLSSCNDFLDKVPDNRTELKTPEQITKLLIDGYSDGNYSLIGELGSDNFIDNNSPDERGNRYNLAARGREDDEAFAWEAVVSITQQDSPSSVWVGAYHAIAVANHALQQIAVLEQAGRGHEVTAQKGEALLIRAYNHFVLVNVFAQAYRNQALSENDPGIPYITEPEKTVQVAAERGTVANVYKLVEKDLMEGLPLIDDGAYEIPKYHFNKKAAHAFAARFYLFKREYEKVVEHATEALGSNPLLIMRDWNKKFPTYQSLVNWVTDASSPNNFLLIATSSVFQRHYWGSARYAPNRDAIKATVNGPGPSWPNYNFHPCFEGKQYINGKSEYGMFFPKAGELFEYIDKIQGIGYPHIIRTEFTAEETLLCRAEAQIYLKNYDAALGDLQIWDKARQNLPTSGLTFTPLTDENIRRFYASAKYGVVKPLHTELMDPAWHIDTQQEYLLQCVLHFRRIETMLDGYRWFDIKRYGIEIVHNIGTSRVETLVWNDPRRAIQLPAEVIAAGMVPNERQKIEAPAEQIKNDAPLIYNEQ